MWSKLSPWVRGTAPFTRAEALRSGGGALIAIVATGLLARLLVSGGALTAAPLLAAPIGASAVLLFAVPASPLAQPRAVIGGNLVSALAGVSCAILIPWPAAAAAAAVALAIAAMALLRCLHPPGGAVALTAVIGGPAVTSLGYGFVLEPIALCSILAVAAAVPLNRMLGHTYPHRAHAAGPHSQRDRAANDPAPRLAAFLPADIDNALARYGDLLDVSREDLDALFRDVELQAEQRLHSQILCADIMSRHPIAVDLNQSAESALHFLQRHDRRSAPVIDERGRVVGMVRRAELMGGRRLGVAMVLDPFAHKVKPATPIQALMPLLSSGAVHEAMVVAEDQTLLGVITQTDLLAVLYRAHIVESLTAERTAA
jgi:CBS domain-containing membrane protein